MTQNEFDYIFRELFQISGSRGFLKAVAIQNHLLALWEFYVSRRLGAQHLNCPKDHFSFIQLLQEHANTFADDSQEQKNHIKAFHSKLEQIYCQLTFFLDQKAL